MTTADSFLPHRSAFQTIVVAAPTLAIVCLLSTSCGQDETPVIAESDSPDSGLPRGFDPGAEGGTRKDSGGPPMCPTTECPAGRATCPGSQFPCDVDLRWDDRNCGACGKFCGEYEAHHAEAVCLEGACTLRCKSHGADNPANCNGLIEDGCEVDLASDKDNCGKCGSPCGPDEICYDSKCICGIAGSCGACGNVCPPSTEPPFPDEWRAGYGCASGRCNQPICASGFSDCNHDLPLPSGDGCETVTNRDPLNCGTCGHVCDPGEVCRGGECRCECGSSCFDKLDRDPENCGTCAMSCTQLAMPGVAAICNQGICEFPCLGERADCDGLPANGCETYILEDPDNCGRCGVRCDGVDGQACVGGRCTVKECQVQ